MKINYSVKKLLLIVISTFGMFTIGYAQLNKLCPISSVVYDKQAVKGMNLLLNTKDFTPYFTPGATTKTTSTVQLVNAAQPFPPLWFQMNSNPDADTGNFITSTFLADLKIQQYGGKLTFFFSYPDKLYGEVSLDTATLIPNDTLTTYKSIYNEVVMSKFDVHDYEIDKNGNQLFSSQVLQKIDARCMSHVASDSNRTAVVNDIIILNPKDSIIFHWNPFDHLSPCEMKWKYRNSSLSYGDNINWSHLNSVRFANDGNIIYSLRHVGLGKINIKTGDVMWKLGGMDSLHAIALTDTSNYYLQHDFSQGEDGLYSVFSNGDLSHQYAEGLLYKIDEVNKKAILVSRYRSNPEIFSLALGSYKCNKNTRIINYGMRKPTATKTLDMAHILVNNKLAAVIQGPQMNFSYQVRETKWAAIQCRPKVILKKDTLYSDAKPGLHDYIWYKIDSTTATPVGTGLSFTPIISGRYVVEAQQGTELFRSYLVSDVIDFKKKK